MTEEFDNESEVKQEPRVVGKIVDGVCDLSDQNLESLFCLGLQFTLEKLNASKNHLTSLRSLKTQPNLKVLDVSFNPIENLDGFERLTKLESLNMLETPILYIENWRLAVIHLVPTLKTLNDVEVTEEERQNAANFTNLDDFTSEDTKYDNAVQKQNQLQQMANYHQNHLGEFKEFAHNEAILWDLRNNGPRPKVSDKTTDDDLKKAIISLRHRNRKLVSTFLKS